MVILDAADEAFYRMRRPSHTQLENVGTDLTNKNEQNKDLIDSLAENPADSAVDMDDSFYDSFRWLDEDDDLDLTLDDYHHAVTETAFPPVLGTHRTPSFRRTVSLTSLRPRQASISLRPPQSSHSTVSPIGSGLGSRPLSTIFTPRHERQSSVVSLESSALHYQDPEARLKLRVYLASPQKFDEAVEFGFPSLDNTTFVQPAAPAGTGRRTQETERSFLDDAVSVLPRDYEDDKEEELSLADTESPRTPQDHIFQYSRPSKKSSVERQGVLRPHILRTSPDPYAQGAPGGREMTLHMTLTRPDLRTDTDIKPSAAKMDDPLKLSDLLLSDERHPIWDTPPEDKSKIKKLWKKLTSR